MTSVIPRRIAIIGTGNVGATTAYALVLNGLAGELVLLDKDARDAEGEAMDLQHAVSLASPMRIWAGTWEDAAHAAIVIIAAGVAGRPGESRLDLLGRNAVVVREIVGRLMDAGFEGILLMTTNPVDILAKIAQETSRLPHERVIGSGTVLDTARLRSMIGEALSVDPRSVHAYIIGEHGDSEIAVWSVSRIAGVPLEQYCGDECPDFEALLQRVRRAAGDIIARKGYTSFAISSCVVRICEALLRDEHSMLPVSALMTGQYGIEGVYMGMPCTVGAGGIERVIELPLDKTELAGLRASAAILRDSLEQLRRESRE